MTITRSTTSASSSSTQKPTTVSAKNNNDARHDRDHTRGDVFEIPIQAQSRLDAMLGGNLRFATYKWIQQTDPRRVNRYILEAETSSSVTGAFKYGNLRTALPNDFARYLQFKTNIKTWMVLWCPGNNCDLYGGEAESTFITASNISVDQLTKYIDKEALITDLKKEFPEP